MIVRCLNSKSDVMRYVAQCACLRAPGNACAQCRALLGYLPGQEVGSAHLPMGFALRVQRLKGLREGRH